MSERSIRLFLTGAVGSLWSVFGVWQRVFIHMTIGNRCKMMFSETVLHTLQPVG